MQEVKTLQVKVPKDLQQKSPPLRQGSVRALSKGTSVRTRKTSRKGRGEIERLREKRKDKISGGKGAKTGRSDTAIHEHGGGEKRRQDWIGNVAGGDGEVRSKSTKKESMFWVPGQRRLMPRSKAIKRGGN